MRAAISALCLSILTTAAFAGGIYKWTGPDGKVHYGDQPPAQGQGVSKYETHGSIISHSANPDTAPTDDDQTAGQAAACEQARQDLAKYQAAPKLIQTKDDGSEHELTPDEIKLVIARKQADIILLCNKNPADAGGKE